MSLTLQIELKNDQLEQLKRAIVEDLKKSNPDCGKRTKPYTCSEFARAVNRFYSGKKKSRNHSDNCGWVNTRQRVRKVHESFMSILMQITQLVRGQAHTLMFSGSIPESALKICPPTLNAAACRRRFFHFLRLGAWRALTLWAAFRVSGGVQPPTIFHPRPKTDGLSTTHTIKSPTRYGRGWSTFAGCRLWSLNWAGKRNISDVKAPALQIS